MKSLIMAFAMSLSASLTWAAPAITSMQKQQQMLSTLDYIRDIYQSNYAPAEWKAKHLGWSLQNEIDLAKAVVQANPNMSLSEYQAVLKKFFQSTKDYHVSVAFYGTERASLPFSVMSAQGRYFIVYIDRAKLPASSFPFAVGDELLSMDGTPVAQLAENLRVAGDNGVLETDKAISEIYLTRRVAKAFVGPVPKGAVVLEVKRKSDQKILKHQMLWNYTAESIPDFSFQSALGERVKEYPLAQRLAKTEMSSPLAKSFMTEGTDLFGIGLRRGYLPELGEKIWESDSSKLFDAYIYRNSANKLIGYVRIPNYVCAVVDTNRSEQKNPAECLAEFAEIMAKFEKTTDGLVIDQLNNPGGSVFYLYALASTLTDQPLYAPVHRFTINQSDVAENMSLLAQLATITTEEAAKKAFGETIHGYPVTYQMVQHMTNYANFVIAEYKAGRQLTQPHFLWGVDQINPHPTSRYTKPVLLLTNALDFSGGDFFPAILQDNKRVTIMGTRTAGAGGYVRFLEFPNILGVVGFSFTGSIAERINSNPIENLGVTPDIPYVLTTDDLQYNFRDYVKAVNSEIQKIVK